MGMRGDIVFLSPVSGLWSLVFRLGFGVLFSILLFSPIPAPGESLWQDGGRGFLFTDLKAARVGDIVTIVVQESSSSNRQAETQLQKEASTGASGAFSGSFDLNDLFPGIKGNVEGSGQFSLKADNAHKGGGSISRTDRVTARIPARVMKVLENGYLLIEGKRAIAVNDETQLLTISGIIRPEDISPDNTISSAQIADAEITLQGKGVIADKQRPGILTRIFDFLRLY